MATPNMPAEEWPDLSGDELRQVGEVLRGADYMQAHEDDGTPVPDPPQVAHNPPEITREGAV
jgi:hypothetical protein